MDATYHRNKIILITAFVTMTITSAVWIGIGAVGYFAMYREPPKFQLEIAHPDTVERETVFPLTVTVKNTGKKDLKLANIDFYHGLLDGFEVIGATPAPDSSERIIDYISYNFSRSLAPGDTFSFELSLKATSTGYWAGDVDACTPTQNLVTHYVEIEVLDPSAP